MNRINAVTSNQGVGKAEMPPTQVQAELMEQKSEGESLLIKCNNLRDRLTSVLRQDNGLRDPNQKSLGQPRPLLVPLAEAIRENTDITRAAIEILREITDRLEIPG